MREPYVVPEHKKLDALLQGFKRRKQHLAVVVDEHGGVSGLVTLEDALEQIVGEISDETDIDEPTIIATRPGEWRVQGKAGIDEVNAALQMSIPDTGEYDRSPGTSSARPAGSRSSRRSSRWEGLRWWSRRGGQPDPGVPGAPHAVSGSSGNTLRVTHL